MQHLSPLDASFLLLETDSVQANIGGVSIFEGPPPAHDDLLRLVGAKLDRVPRYRQRVHSVPLGLSRPVWVDDAHFNLAYHLRRTALPAPGGFLEIEALLGRVMSQHLDRRKPLWEMWVVEGLRDDRWAVLWKLHHAMVDGVSANDLMGEMLDLEREPARAPASVWQPSPPTRTRLALSAARGALSPVATLDRVASRVSRTPREVARRGAATLRTLLPVGGVMAHPHHTSLNGPIGAHRRWVHAAVPLAAVKEVRATSGGTVNDVVLAVITRGFRDLLHGRGEELDARTLRSMVPVSVRSPEERGALANRVSAVFAELPVGIDDPRERLDDIRRQMEHIKETASAAAGDTLVGLAGFAPPMLLALGARLALRSPQSLINTVTTNVPGPQVPLHLAGRRMIESYPYVMLGLHMRITVAIFSYDGNLYFGITGDYESAPDIDVIARGIVAGIDELRGSEASPRRAGGTRASRKKSPAGRRRVPSPSE